MSNTNSYQAKQFNLSNLNGISDRTLEMHFKLYEGYVKETNKLSQLTPNSRAAWGLNTTAWSCTNIISAT